MSSITQDTTILKELLKKADDTGIIAWKIGELSERVKTERSYLSIPNVKYKRFEHYTQSELNKEEATIDIYIKIKQSFKLEEIGNILYSHLKQLVRLRDDITRKTAIKALKVIQNQYVQEKDIVKKEKLFTEENIKNVVDILLKSELTTEKEVNIIILEVLEVKKKQQQQKKVDKVGKDLKLSFFKELEDIISHEPIDEQGTVALFCLLLPYIRKEKFKIRIENRDREISFNKIQFIRSRFPDACLSCLENTKKAELNHLIKIEFEFLSHSYVDHITSKEDCHLIMCWESNISREKYPTHIFPPIIEIKSILKTGIITII